MKQKTKTVQFRRKRQGKTNYKKRLKLLLSGVPRLVIRKSLNNVALQLIEYIPGGDRVILSSHSRELEKYGWNFRKGNMPGAYLTGLLLGKKAKKQKIEKAVLDLGLNASTKGNRIYAALKGAVDGGLNVPHSKEVLPSEDRIKGKHVADFLKNAKTQFSDYRKKGAEIEKIQELFESIKKRIIEENGKEKKGN